MTRILRTRFFIFVALCAVSVAGRTVATTFVPMSDEVLVASSDAIVFGRVSQLRSVVTNGESITTEVSVEAYEILKGQVSEPTVVVSVPGGQVGARIEWIFGAPQFFLEEEVVLFLVRNGQGQWQTNSLGWGKFGVRRRSDGTSAVVRELGQGNVLLDPGGALSSPATREEDLDQFLERIRDLVGSSPGASPGPESPTPATAIESSESEYHAAFTLLGSPPARWHQADSGTPVTYFSTTDSALGVTASMQAVSDALAAWSSVPGSGLVLNYGGLISPTPTPAPGFPTPTPLGYGGCGFNRVIFDDPRGEVTNPSNCSGTLAIGGYCASPANQVTVNGTTFVGITAGKVVMNDGWSTQCPNFWTPCLVAEVITHEIGHSIGLGHSSENPSEPNFTLKDATMYYRAHNDGRCAQVRADDIAAMQFVYPYSGPSFTPTDTRTPTASPTVTPTPTITPTASPTSSPTSSRTRTPTVTHTPTRTPTNTFTPTATRTFTATRTPTATWSATRTATPSATPSATRSATATASHTATPTISATPTESATPSHTATPSITPTATPSPLPSDTPTITATPTETLSPTITATPSVTATPTMSSTPSMTPTFSPTRTSTPTRTATASPSPSATLTRTHTRTATPSPTASFSVTPTRSPTATATFTSTRTATASPTFTGSPTWTRTTSPTRTSTPSRTPSSTMTPTRTPTPQPSATPSATVPPTPTPVPTTSVGGSIVYRQSQEPLSGVQVRVSSPVMEALTDSNGVFQLDAVPLGSARITPYYDGAANFAVTAGDAVVILQAAVGTRTLDAAEALAADVNASGTVTASDAALVLQYVVGAVTEFPASTHCGSRWLFLPQPDPAPNQTIVWPQPTASPCIAGAIVYEPLAAPASGQNFTGVLLGDVNGSWQASTTVLAARDTTVQRGRPQLVKRGRHTSFRAPFRILSPLPFTALEASVRYDTRIFRSVRARLIAPGRNVLLAQHVTGGRLRVAAASAEPIAQPATLLIEGRAGAQVPPRGALTLDELHVD